MHLANPIALFWAALALPIIVFYILKIRLRRLPVTTTIFWRQIFDEKKPRSLWQQLRHLLSLLLQLIFLALLVLALTEPFLRSEFLEARRVILVVDNSASMNATDAASPRLDQARERGLALVAGLRHRDEMAIVTAGTQPRVACGLTGHQRTLRESLTALPATDGPTRLREAVELALRLIAEQADGRRAQVLVLTDGCAEKAEELAKDERVRLISFGSRAGNVGITAFQARRSLLDPIGYEILLEVVNHSDEPREVRLELDLEGVPIDVVPLKLAANEKWTRVIEKTAADGGRLRALLKAEKPDALAADDTARTLLHKREYQPVTLCLPEAHLFLEKVLEAMPLVRLTRLRKAGEAASGPVLAFHREVPAVLPPGPVLVIEPTGPCDLWSVGDKLQNPIVTQQDKESPLMAHVRFDNVLMPEARKLTFTVKAGKPQVLAGAVTGEPLYVALDRPEGKVLVLTVNLEQGDLPLRTAFPILMTNALAWFAGGRGELQEAVATGATLDVELPTGTPVGWLLRGPDGTVRRLPDGAARATLGPFDRCGVWQVVSADAEAKVLREVACNLSSRAESDVRVPEGLAPSAEGEREAAAFTGRPFWFYLLAAAWLLTAVEWYLYQRRWIS